MPLRWWAAALTISSNHDELLGHIGSLYQTNSGVGLEDNTIDVVIIYRDVDVAHISITIVGYACSDGIGNRGVNTLSPM